MHKQILLITIISHFFMSANAEISDMSTEIEKDYINESSSRLFINILDSLSKNYKKLDSTFLKFKDKLEYWKTKRNIYPPKD